MNDLELIERLADLGEHLDRELVAAADGLADSVVAVLDAERGPGSDRLVSDQLVSDRRMSARRARLWSLAAAVVLLVVLLVALPGARRTIARWFGVGSVRIEPVSTTPVSTTPESAQGAGDGDGPAATATSGVESDPGPGADPLGLGPPVSADDAVAATGLPLPVARSLGEPESFHLPGGPQIVARYDIGGRTVLVAVLVGSTEEAVFAKAVDPGQITSVDVIGVGADDARGLWIEGEPHTFGYLGADGEFGTEPLRLAGDTLVWERSGTTLRVEGARDLAEALEIAASMEP
jgi:hypothetical protein